MYRLAWLGSHAVFLTRLTFDPPLTLLREQVAWARGLPAGQQATWRPILYVSSGLVSQTQWVE